MTYAGPTKFPAHLLGLDDPDSDVAQANFQKVVDGLGTKELPRVFGPLQIDLAGAHLVTAPKNTTIKQDWVKITGPGAIKPSEGSGDLLVFSNMDGPGGLFSCGITDIGIDMANRGKAVIRCYQTPFFTAERVTVERSIGDTLRFDGCVGPIIDKVYLRDALQGLGDGLVLSSIKQGETQRASVTNYRCYDYLGFEIRIQEGVGHFLCGLDVESCRSGGIQMSSALGNVILGGYTEFNGPSGAGPDLHMIERQTFITTAPLGPRYLQYNMTGYCYFTSDIGVQVDGNANSQYNFFDMMVISGQFKISADTLGTTLGPCMFVNRELIDLGNDTTKLYCNAVSPEMYWRRGRGKRLSITVGAADGGYVDYTSDIGLRFQKVASLSAGSVARKNLAYTVELPANTTAIEVTFPWQEVDTNYAILLTPFTLGRALPDGFSAFVIEKRPNGVRIGVTKALASNIKIDLLLVGLKSAGDA